VLNQEGQVVAQLPLEEPGLLVFDFPCDGQDAGARLK
jgi:hypothetical protein